MSLHSIVLNYLHIIVNFFFDKMIIILRVTNIIVPIIILASYIKLIMPTDCISYQNSGYFSTLMNDYLEKNYLQSLYNRFPKLENFE
jgi:hypothetical protein